MAYSKKTWANRQSEYPNRYRMTSTNGNIADVAIVPNEGTVSVEGDKFSADTMNDMETRIKNGFDSADTSISNLNTTLRGVISAETTRATGEENLIKHDVDVLEDGLANEITRATGAENTLTTNLASEVSRATGVESGHNTRITSLEGRMTDAEEDIETTNTRVAGLETSISTEISRAQQVESGLQTDINSVESNLNSEISRAQTVESNLTTNLSNEITRAQNAESTLQTSINNEATRAQGAESTLTTNLAAEVSRAQTAESNLHDYVDQKIGTTYKPSGSVYFEDLPPITAARNGNVYNIKDDFTTTNNFAEGAGKHYPAGSNVAIEGIEGDYYTEVVPVGTENPMEEGWYILDTSGTSEEYVLTSDTEVVSGTTYYSYSDIKYMYDVMAGLIDTSHFITDTDYATLLAAGIVKPDGTTTSIDNDGTIHSLGGGQGTAEAAERMIAPIEADETSSSHAYTVGEQLIVNEVLYDVIDNIAIGDALVTGTGGNIKVADNVTTQLGTKYDTEDSASTTINDTDYVPMSESGGTKKKTLWSTIVAKIKSALGISTTGSTYLKKDGTWDTPTNTTYTFATGDNNGQIKITPSGGSAQNVSVKGLGSAAYTASTTYAASSHTHNYAGSSSVGGPANSVGVSRVNTDYNNDLPGANKCVVKEHSSDSANRPSDDWYYVMTSQGSDTAYGTQIAFGMTTEKSYIRHYNGGSWGSWLKFYDTGNKPTKSDVGLSNVPNYNTSKAIKSITRNGTTFTATALDGTTSTFTQQDNNTTYSAGAGLFLNSSNVFTVSYGTSAGTACQGNDSRVTNAIQNGGAANLSWIEFTTAEPHFIDFHYNGSLADYTFRMHEYDSGKLSMNGVVVFTGSLYGDTGISSSASLNDNSMGSLVHWDNQAAKPYIWVDGTKHHWNFVD